MLGSDRTGAPSPGGVSVAVGLIGVVVVNGSSVIGVGIGVVFRANGSV